MYNFIFMLETKSNCLLPSFTGQIIRGALLSTINEFDATFAEKLHKGNDIRPYAVSPLMGHEGRLNRTRRNEIIVSKDRTYKFRMGILSSDLAEQMIKISLQNDKMRLQLADAKFTVSSIEIKKKTIKELLDCDDQQSKFIELSFLTPSCFNIAGKDFPMRFPDPRFLFMNLATLWNTFNEEQVFIDRSEFFTWLESNISINRYKLSTHRVYTAKNTPKIGFKGFIRYRLSDDNKYQSWIHALAQYAEFSNVGSNRTAGLGCVKYIR